MLIEIDSMSHRSRKRRLPAEFTQKHEHANPQCLHGSLPCNCERSGLWFLPAPSSSVSASHTRTPPRQKTTSHFTNMQTRVQFNKGNARYTSAFLPRSWRYICVCVFFFMLHSENQNTNQHREGILGKQGIWVDPHNCIGQIWVRLGV